MLFDGLLNELVNEEALELKLRRFYDYSASFALVPEPPVIEAPSQNFFLIQSPSFTFMNSNSSKQTPFLGNPTPSFNPEGTNLTFPGNSGTRAQALEELPPIRSVRQSSTNPMYPPARQEQDGSNKGRTNESAETVGNKIKINDGWTLERLAQNYDENENIPKISNKKKYNQLIESARKSLPFKVHIHEDNSVSQQQIERTVSDIVMQNENVDEEFDEAEAFFYESGSEDNYEITEHSSNESSNNLSHHIEYRDENGNKVSNPNQLNMSKFIDGHSNHSKPKEKEDNFNGNILSMLSGNKTPTQYEVVSGHETPSRIQTPQFRIYYNRKKIPRWAENFELVKKRLIKQKQTNLHLTTFGVMRPIANLNLECIMGAEPKSPINRSDSIMWLTPESLDRKGQKVNVSKAMQDVRANKL